MQNGFDGVVNDSIPAEYYIYKIVVTSADNVSQKFDGGIASVPCQEPTGLPAPNNLDNCAFSSQYSPLNGYDASIDSNEMLDCFE